MRLAVSPISFIFQFTPLCERLRLYHFPCGSLQIISIHASLREATVVSLYLVSVVSISIHASLREATVTHIPRLTHTFISIHASLREAT